MSKLFSSRDILQVLLKLGFEETSQRGSHLKLRKNGRTVIGPHPKSLIPHGTLSSILKQAGLTKQQFLELL